MAAKTQKQQINFLKPIGKFFRRFHMLLFFIFVVAIVAGSVYFINNALTNTSDGGYTSSIEAGSIDQSTLERIQSLHSSANPSPAPQLQGGRVNPFSE